MRLDLVAESIPDKIALMVGAVPAPLLHTQVAALLAQTVMEATRGGVFEALSDGPRSAGDVATACGFDANATEKLLRALVPNGYLTRRDDGYALTPMARKWLLASSPVSQRDKTIFALVEAATVAKMGDFLKTGTSEIAHAQRQDPEFWRLYQPAMRSLAALSASEVRARTFVPKGATTMADLGGSHGLYSVALCRRHPALTASIIDLPAAIEHAAPLLAKEGLGDRVKHVPGDIRECDLGESRYDLLFLSNVVHHFDAPTNLRLMARAARALKPGGAVVVQEAMRREDGKGGGQLGALLDLYFALTSQAGTWSYREIAAWQRDAGLVPRAPLKMRTLPGGGQQTAVKN